MSFLDVAGLPAPDVIAALFVKNYNNALKEGQDIITKLVQLVVNYGNKEQAHW